MNLLKVLEFSYSVLKQLILEHQNIQAILRKLIEAAQSAVI